MFFFILKPKTCFFQGRVEDMGTFNELLTSGKDFVKLLSAGEDTKDKDSLSVNSVSFIQCILILTICDTI